MNKKRIALAKVVAFTLAASYVFSNFPTVAYAQEKTKNMTEKEEHIPAIADNNLSGECGEENSNVRWELKINNQDTTNSTYTLNISGNGKMNDFNDAKLRPWHTYADKITKIVIGEGITYISKQSLRDLTKVEEISLSETVTSIGDAAFSFCGVKDGNTTLHLRKNVSNIDHSFRYTYISNFTVDEANSHFKTKDGILYTKDGKELVSYPIGRNDESFDSSWLDGVEKIWDQAFFGKIFSKPTNIVIPDTVKYIGVQAFSSVWAIDKNKNNNFTIDLPDSLEIVKENAFFNCYFVGCLKLGKNLREVHTNSFATTSLEAVDITEISDNIDFSVNGGFTIQNNAIIYINNEEQKDSIDKIIAGEKNHWAITNGGSVPSNSEIDNYQLTTLTKPNYKFIGWYDNKEFNEAQVTTPEEGKTYYAKFEEKTVPTISFNSDLDLNRVYNGKAISLTKDDYVITTGAGDVTFDYQIKDGETWKDIDSAPTNAGIYRVKALVAENDTYKEAESNWKEFTISKANPTEDSYKDKIPTNLTATTGQILANVKLPEGFKWKDSTTSVGDVGTHEFDAIYTPEDTLNYNYVDIKINVKVEQRYVPSIPSKPDEKPSIGVNVDVVDKISGETRYDTSVGISKKVFPATSEKVYLVSGEKFPDALSSAALAGKGDGPILLINDKNIDKILSEIDRLDAKEIVFIGGNSISDANEAKIRKFAKENSSVVKSIVGKDRYETAVKVAEQTISKYGNKGKVIIADGRNYPDAVSIASYAAKEGIPVILVNGNKVPDVVKNFLNKYKIKSAIIVGGDKAVGKDVEKLFKSVDRIAGEDRYDTSKKIAEKFFADSKTVFVASGESFADSLSVSYYAGSKNAPILLTKANALDNDTKEYLEKNKDKNYIIVGGDKAINPDLFK